MLTGQHTIAIHFAEGVAGANAFRADAALVVTWYNTASMISGRSDIDSGQLATYQVVWLTDLPARLSYVIINYDKLGFDAADFRGNSRSGRCQVSVDFIYRVHHKWVHAKIFKFSGNYANVPPSISCLKFAYFIEHPFSGHPV